MIQQMENLSKPDSSHETEKENTPKDKSVRISPLQYIKGVGPKRAEALAQAGILTANDLLMYVPRSYIDRTTIGTISTIQRRLQNPDMFDATSRENVEILRSEITLVGSFVGVREHSYGKGRKMLIGSFSDGSGAQANIIFFNFVEYFRKVLKTDGLFAVSGKPELDKFGKVTFSHPDIERIEQEDVDLYSAGKIIPKYTITQSMKNANIGMRGFRQLVEAVLEQETPTIDEVLPSTILTKHNFPDRSSAIHSLHFPQSADELRKAKERMKFEELFFFEVLLALRQKGVKMKEKAPQIIPPSPTARKLVEQLPFELTTAQKRVINEIVNDMKTDKPMNRLLQGDVGSGKTIVALLTMLMSADNGFQSLLLAPTEILAEQHYQGIKRWCEGLNIEVVQLVGGLKKRMRNEVLDKIANGTAKIIIGTHALFGGTSSKGIEAMDLRYNNVGLIVVDEQHRFGVMQRAKLRELGTRSHDSAEVRSPHMLVMSATPIPRTLSMTLYGDLDVSIINELPKNRKPIQTKVIFESGLNTYYDKIRSEVQSGRQAYIVYPLVEESEKLELKSAVMALEELQNEVFPELKLGLLHGQMLWYEKEDAMKAFLNKEYDILVATTVVEVGIDVPNATVMLIQNAERFGLAQLHQLRGRVGRGAEQSYCYLATKDHYAFHLRKKEAELSDKLNAIARLKTMESTTDGFMIAEVDLRLRGPGDVMGTRQSGVPDFQFADLVNDEAIIQKAKFSAFEIVGNDPHLRKPENQSLRRHFIKQYKTTENMLDVA